MASIVAPIGSQLFTMGRTRRALPGRPVRSSTTSTDGTRSVAVAVVRDARVGKPLIVPARCLTSVVGGIATRNDPVALFGSGASVASERTPVVSPSPESSPSVAVPLVLPAEEPPGAALSAAAAAEDVGVRPGQWMRRNLLPAAPVLVAEACLPMHRLRYGVDGGGNVLLVRSDSDGANAMYDAGEFADFPYNDTEKFLYFRSMYERRVIPRVTQDWVHDGHTRDRVTIKDYVQSTARSYAPKPSVDLDTYEREWRLSHPTNFAWKLPARVPHGRSATDDLDSIRHQLAIRGIALHEWQNRLALYKRLYERTLKFVPRRTQASGTSLFSSWNCAPSGKTCYLAQVSRPAGSAYTVALKIADVEELSIAVHRGGHPSGCAPLDVHDPFAVFVSSRFVGRIVPDTDADGSSQKWAYVMCSYDGEATPCSLAYDVTSKFARAHGSVPTEGVHHKGGMVRRRDVRAALAMCLSEVACLGDSFHVPSRPYTLVTAIETLRSQADVGLRRLLRDRYACLTFGTKVSAEQNTSVCLPDTNNLVWVATVRLSRPGVPFASISVRRLSVGRCKNVRETESALGVGEGTPCVVSVEHYNAQLQIHIPEAWSYRFSSALSGLVPSISSGSANAYFALDRYDLPTARAEYYDFLVDVERALDVFERSQ